MEDKSMGEAKRRRQAAGRSPGKENRMHPAKEKLLNTATRSGLHAGIIEVVTTAIDRGIHPMSPEMIDVIRASFPSANQREAEAAAEFATRAKLEAVFEDYVKNGVCVRTGKIENGWPVYADHPRIDALMKTNGWTREATLEFVKQNPLQ
jgi:hypothetical protein